MKSKQKAVCEKLQLRPNKGSVALRQGLRSAPRVEKVSLIKCINRLRCACRTDIVSLHIFICLSLHIQIVLIYYCGNISCCLV